jgi:hypothetical protein
MQERRNHYLHPRGPVIPFNSISGRHNRNTQQQHLSKVKTKRSVNKSKPQVGEEKKDNIMLTAEG